MNDDSNTFRKPPDPLNGADRKGDAIENIPDETTNHIDEILLFYQRKALLTTLIEEHIGILMTPLQLEVISRQLHIFGKFPDSHGEIAKELNRRYYRRRLGLSPTQRLRASDIAEAEKIAVRILRNNYGLALQLHHTTLTAQEVRRITPAKATAYIM